MQHEFIEKILSVLLLTGIFFVLPGQVPSTQAAILPSGIPVGGVVAAFVPPTPLCPVAHTIVASFNGAPIALTMAHGSQLYPFYNLVKPGTFILGTYLPAPVPCAVPYLIYPIAQVGTSA
ncbi:hypothetical protein IPM19_03550 [bacterium]|nr:MAG: hypothetical protein IPM19_03550 [bacterium]